MNQFLLFGTLASSASPRMTSSFVFVWCLFSYTPSHLTIPYKLSPSSSKLLGKALSTQGHATPTTKQYFLNNAQYIFVVQCKYYDHSNGFDQCIGVLASRQHFTRGSCNAPCYSLVTSFLLRVFILPL